MKPEAPYTDLEDLRRRCRNIEMFNRCKCCGNPADCRHAVPGRGEMKPEEVIARTIEPLAWAHLGMADTKDKARIRERSLDRATAALRALDEAGYVLTKVSVVTDPRDFLSTPPEGLRTIGDKPFGRA